MNDLDSVHTLTFDKPGQFKAGTVQGLNLALKDIVQPKKRGV